MTNRLVRHSSVILSVSALAALGLAAPASAANRPAPPGHGAANRPAAAQSGAGDAPLVGTGAARALPGQYIVVLRKGTPASARKAARDQARGNGARIKREYGSVLSGFAATLSPAAVGLLRKNPQVAYVEADQAVTASATQTPATWGLDRIDQRNLPLNNSYTYNATGAGVTAYIIDTGIRTTHSQFGGRASVGNDTVGDGQNGQDCNGHGTHVAGTVGSSTYGVAKGVQLVAVRVLNCQGSGTTSGVIAGIDWVTSHHSGPAVANMSLGGAASPALDNAVANSIASGVSYAVAAGNDNANACNSSPARVTAAITVGATTNTDVRSSFSNFGTCVDLFAPGTNITSAWNTSDTATNTISGTSMATPHAAGAAALYLQGSPSASPQAVRDQLVNTATAGVVTSPGTGSPNRLLYTLGGTTPPPPPPPPSGTCGLPESHPGSLTGTGDADLQPNGTYFQAAAGTHKACLRGPSGADFDLALYRWSGAAWSRVAVSQGVTSAEDVTYNGTAGYYYWRVYSYSGAGAYTFGMKRP
jgi:subtilisin family serine protease